MARLVTMMIITLAIIPSLLFAANAVVVQSKSASISDDSVQVGVYIENDIDLSAIVLPLTLREVTNGSFIGDTLFVKAANRLLTRMTGYRVISYMPDPDNANPSKCGGTGFSTRGLPDFESPDALLFATIAGDFEVDTCLEAGDDGTPPSGSPSLYLTFGVNAARGSFEIDTTCITPSNRFALADCEVPAGLVAATFTKGIIEIGGPFWAADTITGHITSNAVIEGNVRMTGDVTVDSGVTLTLLRGSRLIAEHRQDDQHSGDDTTRVELVIKGTLAIDTLAGSRPTLTSEVDSLASWHGVRVTSKGRFNTGIGSVIENARVGLRIEKTTLADTLTGLVVRDCDSVGISNAGNIVALRLDTILGIAAGMGIYVDSGGPLIEQCHVDSCYIGISTFKSWSTIKKTTILGPGLYGIRIENQVLVLGEGDGWRNRRDPVHMAAEGQVYQVNLKYDTVSGYFSGAQFYMGFGSSICSIDSCGFIHPTGTTRSPLGLSLGANDTVTVRRSVITGFTTTGVSSNGSKANLGVNTSSPGNNFISTDSSGCGGCLLRRVSHTGTDSIKAESNWWGSSSPPSSWFSGKVDRTPYLTDPPAKFTIPDDGGDQAPAAALPAQYMLAQNYPNPFNASTEIEFSIKHAQQVNLTVYNILGQVVKTLANSEFSEGTHRITWNATNNRGSRVASGIYLYRITTGTHSETKKMALLK